MRNPLRDCLEALAVGSNSSLSMAITFRDGVILGADSRTTSGAYIANRVTDKLTQVHDTIWCCRSGSAADTQAVADIVQYHLGMYGITNEEGPTTQTAAALFQELCYSNKDQLRFVDPFPARDITQTIWRKSAGKDHVENLCEDCA